MDGKLLGPTRVELAMVVFLLSVVGLRLARLVNDALRLLTIEIMRNRLSL